MLVLEGHPDREVVEVGQELVQRRVDQPDGDRRPSICARMSAKSSRCSGSSSASAASLPASSVGEDEPLDQLARVAEEHVLGAAQADARGAEAAGARGVVGVSAFARTPRRRTASACVEQAVDRVAPGRPRGVRPRPSR